MTSGRQITRGRHRVTHGRHWVADGGHRGPFGRVGDVRADEARRRTSREVSGTRPGGLETYSGHVGERRTGGRVRRSRRGQGQDREVSAVWAGRRVDVGTEPGADRECRGHRSWGLRCLFTVPPMGGSGPVVSVFVEGGRARAAVAAPKPVADLVGPFRVRRQRRGPAP
ncbi:hypothetical protein SMALA_4995 [Streptomyces malaysiensis subsp. malaysiensis]|nr:hypothetical protein SMALA_4995 [Streptomyces malaysiensis]